MEGISAGATSAGTSSAASTTQTTSSNTSTATQGKSSPGSGTQNFGTSSQNSNPNPNAQSLQSKPEGANQTPPEQSKPEPKRLGEQDLDALVTVKINGKTQDLPLKEVIKLQQLEQASHEKMRQAAEIQRRAQELMQLDIDKFAQMRGLDLDALAEERLAKKYELMQMTPEQRELYEYKQREAQYQERVNQQRNQLLEQIKQYSPELPPGLEQASPEYLYQYMVQAKQNYEMIEQNLERDLVQALHSVNLKNKFFASQIAYHMMNGKNPDGTPLQAQDAAAKVRKEFDSAVRDELGKMDAQAIQEFLGKEVLTKLREFDVQRVTAGQAASMPQRSPGNEPASTTKKYVNQFEWRRQMGLD